MRRLDLQINWKHAVGEFILIVTGVLVALAVSAFWERRQDHGREHRYIEQLAEDSKHNQQRLRDAIAEDSQRYEVVGKIVHAMSPQAALPPDDSLRAWWSMGPLGFSEPRLVLGTLVALVQSGDSRLFRNDRVRLEVLGYLEEMQDGLNAVRRLELQHGNLVPAILERIEPVRVTDPAANFELDFPATLPRLRQDPTARSSVRVLWGILWSRIFYLQRMADQTDSLRHRLEDELERRP